MKLTIDDRIVELLEGATVLDGVNRLGIPLPQLCKDPDRAPLGACRTCLVHVEGQRGLPASCHLPAREGMVVSTGHADALRVRKAVLDLTLSMLTPQNGFAQLSDAGARHGLLEPRWAPLHRFEVDASKSFFVLDREACILCGRCAVGCDDVQQIGATALLGRGHGTKVGVFGDSTMASSVCTSCGQCVATCPTGALRPKEAPAKIVRHVETTCPYCGVGCGISVNVRDNGHLAVMADDVPSNKSSLGMLCVKGRFGTGFIHARDRITSPMIRRDGRWVEVGWDEALDAAAEGLAKHRGRFGALASAKATNEDGYVIQKFCRVVMRTNDVDHCTRLCHSPSVEAMLASMGSGATSNSYQDYEESGCLMVVGADASANHPVIAIRFRRAVSRGARLIVVNPKRVELCDQADLWIQQRPGTDVPLFNAMARVILDEGLAAREFIEQRTEGFEAWREALAPFTLEHAARVTGVPAGDIAQAARWYARPASSQGSREGGGAPFSQRSGSCLIWGMGITQHVNGIHNAHALLNLSLVAGQMGFPGSGISSSTRRRSARTSSCPPRPSPRRKARSRTPSGASSACAPRCRRRARRDPTGGSPRSWPSASREAWASTSARSSITRGRRTSSTRWRASPRSSRASRTHGSTARAACSGRARLPSIPARATSTASRSRAAAAASSRRARSRRPRSCPTPTTRSCSTRAGSSTTGTAARSRAGCRD